MERPKPTALQVRSPLCLLLLFCLAASVGAGCSRQDFTRPVLKDVGPPEAPTYLPVYDYNALVKPSAEAEAAIAQWREETGAGTGRYRLGTGDVIAITIFGAEDAPGVPAAPVEATINEAGRVRLPAVGDVEVAGKSVDQLQQELDQLYAAKYQRAPQVRVDVTNYRSQRVFVTGAVTVPGTQSIVAGRTDLLSVLSDAGWMTPEAGDTIIVLRPGRAASAGEGEQSADGGAAGQAIRVDLHQLIEQGNMDHNIEVQGGDIINVLAREDQYINVLGYVNGPTAIPMPRATKRIPVTTALALAGGLNRFARADRSILIRTEGDKQTAYAVDLISAVHGDVPLWVRAGDTIVVGSAWDARFVEVSSLILGGVSTARNVTGQ